MAGLRVVPEVQGEKKQAKTVPCGAPVLHSSVPETYLPILTYCGLAVK